MINVSWWFFSFRCIFTVYGLLFGSISCWSNYFCVCNGILLLVEFTPYWKSSSWNFYLKMITYCLPPYKNTRKNIIGFQIIVMDELFSEWMPGPIHAPYIIDDMLLMISSMDLLWLPIFFFFSVISFYYGKMNIFTSLIALLGDFISHPYHFQ